MVHSSGRRTRRPVFPRLRPGRREPRSRRQRDHRDDGDRGVLDGSSTGNCALRWRDARRRARLHAADVRHHARPKRRLRYPIAGLRGCAVGHRRAAHRRQRRRTDHQHRDRPPGTRHRPDRRRDRARAAGLLRRRPRRSRRAARARGFPRRRRMTTVALAVNGTLMRGLELNANMIDAGATFVCEAMTAPTYRLWSIDDRHPAMIRTATAGRSIAVEVWAVPPEGLARILLQEPSGLCVGKVKLADGKEVLGVLGEPLLVEGQREITDLGGWRAYLATKKGSDATRSPA